MRREWHWDEKRLQCLALVFSGQWKQGEIAERCNISTRTVGYWQEHPAFLERLQALRADTEQALSGTAFFSKVQRIVALQEAATIALDDLRAHPRNYETKQGMGGTSILREDFNDGAHAALLAALAGIASEKGERVKRAEIRVDEHITINAAREELFARLERLRQQQALPGSATITELPYQ